MVGAMYEEGNGVPQDYISAYMWWTIAASEGEKLAKKGLDEAAPEMSPAQIETAKKLAREWMEKHRK